MEFTEINVGERKIEDTPAYKIVNKEDIEATKLKTTEINVGSKEEPKTIRIRDYWDDQTIGKAQQLFEEFCDVFTWSFKDLKGIPPEVGMHHIDLMEGAKLVKQRPYHINLKYKEKAKADLDKMLEAGYIYDIDYNDWVSSIVVVPKKSGKIRVCVDYRQLKKVMKKDPFPLPFIEDILEAVGGNEIYSFIDGFSGYNQV